MARTAARSKKTAAPAKAKAPAKPAKAPAKKASAATPAKPAAARVKPAASPVKPAAASVKAAATPAKPAAKSHAKAPEKAKAAAKTKALAKGDAPAKEKAPERAKAPEKAPTPPAPGPKAAPEAHAPAPAAPPAKAAKARRERRSAGDLAKGQREISVSEFFEKNRHLLGFDNPAKALLTTVREAVDNALDACEEAGILPAVKIEIVEVVANARYRVVVEDNGPGIVKAQIPRVFGKLLYGSKFHRLRQSLTADQPVLFERNGRLERAPIGAFVDGLLGCGQECTDVSRLGLRVPAFDPSTWRYAWRPVSHVIRHERTNEVLEVRTERGMSVRVTGCHSLFAFDAARREVVSVEARTLKRGDFIVAPNRLPGLSPIARVNLLDHLEESDLSGRWIYVYGVPQSVLAKLVDEGEVIHKRSSDGRSRRYYRVARPGAEPVEILDGSMSKYVAKGFLPALLVKNLGLEGACASGVLRTYHHGRPCETPVTWSLTPGLMRLLGLYVAEGHADRRRVAFTLSVREQPVVEELAATARALGLSASIEMRPRHAIRLKVFGCGIELLLGRWCARGAKNKRAPEFVFHASRDLRQSFLDGLYQGDGHRVKGRNVLMLSSVSRELIADVETLWLLQGVLPCRSGPWVQKGLGREPSTSWRLEVFGADIESSRQHAREGRRKASNYRAFPARSLALARGGDAVRIAPNREALARAAGLGLGSAGPARSLGVLSALRPGSDLSIADLERAAGGRVTKHLPEHLVRKGYLEATTSGNAPTRKAAALLDEMATVEALSESDLCLLKVQDVREVEDTHRFVYDLSVPGCENFVAGEGALACHNSRGQQGIGISAAGLYGLITTGKPVVITSRTGARAPAHHFELVIDTKRNEPHVTVDTVLDEWAAEHGTRVEIELSGSYKGGRRSVDEYVEQTALANPHAEFSYSAPKRSEPLRLPRVVEELPPEPETVKPHPHGVELGVFLRMARDAGERTLHSVLTQEFSRVNAKAAAGILAAASFSPRARAGGASREQLEALFRALQAAKLPAPSTSSVVPIGEALVRKGLEREAPRAELYVTRTRPPRTYRGNVFVVEVGLAYGGEARSAYDAAGVGAATAPPAPAAAGAGAVTGATGEAAPAPPPPEAAAGRSLTITGGASLSAERRIDLGLLEVPGMTRAKAQELCHTAGLDPLRKAGTLSEEELDRLRAAYEADVQADVASRPIELVRLANRVPLQYQQSACAITQAVMDTNWKRYGLTQPRGGMPLGPLVLVVHIASVWVPYTSESKEAIAHYPEILEEIQRGLMECGRQLGAYLNKRAFDRLQAARRDKIELYAGELVEALAFLSGRPKEEVREAMEIAKRKNIAIDDEPAAAPAPADATSAKKPEGPEEDA